MISPGLIQWFFAITLLMALGGCGDSSAPSTPELSEKKPLKGEDRDVTETDSSVFSGKARSFSIKEDGELSSVLIEDVPSKLKVSFSLSRKPESGKIAIVNEKTGEFIYSPDLNFFGTDTFDVNVSNGTLSVITSATINVTPENDAPVSENIALDVDEDSTHDITLKAADPDKDTLSFQTASNPLHGTLTMLDATLGKVRYKPTIDYVGPDSFTFKVSDGSIETSTFTVSITVKQVNDRPLATDIALTTLEDTAKAAVLAASDPENAPLTFAIVTQPTNGSVVLNNASTGAFTYTPGLNKNGTDSFTFKANDGNSDSLAATANITITPVNDAPDASNGTQTLVEDTPSPGILNGSDPDGNSMVFSVVVAPLHGTVAITNTATGDYTFTPTLNYQGPDSFTFKVSDGTLQSATKTQSITITAADDAPVANNASITVNEDVVSTGTLVASDIDGDPITFSIVTNATKGLAEITNAATGAFRYTPNANLSGADSFTFKATTNGIASNTATISINILGVNDAPSASVKSVSGSEDTLLNSTLSGTDPEGSALTFAVVTSPLKGTLILTPGTGAFTYEPDANYFGSDSFTFKVNDGLLDSAPAAVTITIAGVNDAPKAANGSLVTNENTAANGTMNATDVDSSSLTFSLVSSPTKGSLLITNASTGAYTYTPNNGYDGPDSFTFRASDGSLTSTATVSITVGAVNDAPVATNASLTVVEDVAKSGNLVASDVDSASLFYSIVASPLHGTISLIQSTGAYVYTPALNYFGPDSFTFKVSDSQLDSNTATVSISITAVNDSPVASSATTIISEEIVLNAKLIAADIEGSALTYVLVAPPSSGLVILTDLIGGFRYTPNANFFGTDSFTFKVNDGTVDSSVATFSISVTGVNDAPSATNGTLVVTEDVMKTGTLVGSDIDSATLTYSIIGNPTLGSVSITNANTGAFSYTTLPNANGNDSFTFRVSDGALVSTVATISVSITPVNDAPVVTNGILTVNEDTAGSATLLGNDGDSPSLTFSIVTPPVIGSVTITNTATGAYTYTPNANANGGDNFVFRVSDGSLSSTSTVAVTINSVNDAPTSQSPAISTAEDTPKSGTLFGADIDSSTLTFSMLFSPSNGSVTISSVGAYTYTPYPNFAGTDSFVYRVSDGTLSSPNGVVTITVTPASDPPTTTGKTFVLTEDTPYSGSLSTSASDPDGDALTFYMVTGSAKGSFFISNASTGAFTYTPNTNTNGTDTATFRVHDGTGYSNISTITFSVTPANDPPTASSASASIAAGSVLNSILSGGDPDGDSITYSVVSTPQFGSVTISPTGGFTYTPNTNMLCIGVDTFTFRTKDATTYSGVATVYVTVTDLILTQYLTVPNNLPSFSDLPTQSLKGVVKSGSNVYVASLNGLGISRDNGATFITRTTANGLGHNLVYSVTVNGSNVYAATAGGFSISTNGGLTFANRTVAEGLPNSSIIDSAIDGTSIYVATTNGLSISTNGGSTFFTKTTADGLGSLIVNAVYASGGTVFAGTSNGLAVSTNGGNSFVNKTTANGLPNNSIRGIYKDGTKIYVATSSGLAYSSDNGTTFTTMSGAGIATLFSVYASGANIYLASSAGVMISNDTGATFAVKNLANGVVGTLSDIVVSGSEIFATSTNGLVTSTNGGSSFTTRNTTAGIKSSTIYGIAHSASSIYLATSLGLSISNDNGLHYVNKTSTEGMGSPPVNGVTLSVDLAGKSVIYAATNGGLSSSSDGGITWVNKTTANGLGQNSTNSVAANGARVYVATSVGLAVSNDYGASFTNKTSVNGLGSSVVYDVAFSGAYVYAATAGGVSVSTDYGATFINRTTVDGLGSNNARCIYAAGATIYACTNTGISTSTNSGTSFTYKSYSASAQTRSVYPDSVGPTLYVGTFLGLYTLQGTTTSLYMTPAGLGGVSVYAIAKKGTQLYFGTEGGLTRSP